MPTDPAYSSRSGTKSAIQFFSIPNNIRPIKCAERLILAWMSGGVALSRYEIRNEEGRGVNNNILERYYGNSWKAVLDRLNHRYDGYLMTIHQQDFEYHVYRVFNNWSSTNPTDF